MVFEIYFYFIICGIFYNFMEPRHKNIRISAPNI